MALRMNGWFCLRQHCFSDNTDCLMENTVAKCLIWGTPAKAEPRLGDYGHINSRRAGGEYKVPGSNQHAMESLSELEKKRLTFLDCRTAQGRHCRTRSRWICARRHQAWSRHALQRAR